MTSLLPLIHTTISKNDTLVSLISHVNWSVGWKLLTQLINCSISRRQHDAVPTQSPMCCTYQDNQVWDQCIVQRFAFPDEYFHTKSFLVTDF